LDLRREADRLLREIEESSEFIENRWDRVELHAIEARYRALHEATGAATVFFGVVASAIPLIVFPLAQALAGKNTRLTISISFGVIVTIALIAGATALWLKVRHQRAELRRLREYAARLEERVRSNESP
jgi:phospholipid N-methyltransferase